MSLSANKAIDQLLARSSEHSKEFSHKIFVEALDRDNDYEGKVFAKKVLERVKGTDEKQEEIKGAFFVHSKAEEENASIIFDEGFRFYGATDSNISLLLSRFANVYREAGEYEKAINFYNQSQEKGSKVRKDNSVSYGCMAETYMKWGKYEDALKYLKIMQEQAQKDELSEGQKNIISEVLVKKTEIIDLIKNMAKLSKDLGLDIETDSSDSDTLPSKSLLEKDVDIAKFMDGYKAFQEQMAAYRAEEEQLKLAQSHSSTEPASQIPYSIEEKSKPDEDKVKSSKKTLEKQVSSCFGNAMRGLLSNDTSSSDMSKTIDLLKQMEATLRNEFESKIAHVRAESAYTTSSLSSQIAYVRAEADSKVQYARVEADSKVAYARAETDAKVAYAREEIAYVRAEADSKFQYARLEADGKVAALRFDTTVSFNNFAKDLNYYLEKNPRKVELKAKLKTIESDAELNNYFKTFASFCSSAFVSGKALEGGEVAGAQSGAMSLLSSVQAPLPFVALIGLLQGAVKLISLKGSEKVKLTGAAVTVTDFEKALKEAAIDLAVSKSLIIKNVQLDQKGFAGILNSLVDSKDEYLSGHFKTASEKLALQDAIKLIALLKTRPIEDLEGASLAEKIVKFVSSTEIEAGILSSLGNGVGKISLSDEYYKQVATSYPASYDAAGVYASSGSGASAAAADGSPSSYSSGSAGGSTSKSSGKSMMSKLFGVSKAAVPVPATKIYSVTAIKYDNEALVKEIEAKALLASESPGLYKFYQANGFPAGLSSGDVGDSSNFANEHIANDYSGDFNNIIGSINESA